VRLRPIALLGLFVAAAFLTRAPFLGFRFLDLDESAALLGSWELLRGGRLYVDFVDNRPPLFYLAYALPQMLLGPGMLAVRLFAATIVLPLTALGASAFYRHDRRGVAAGLLYLVYGAAFLAHDMQAVSPELLMLLPLAWAAVLLREEADAGRPARLLGAGVLVGTAALVRQQAAVWLPALGLVAWLAAPGRSARRTARLGALLVGFALPLALVYRVFVGWGAGEELVFWTWTHNLRYARNPILASEALERAVSYLLPFLLVTAPLWYTAWRGRSLVGPPHARRVAWSLIAFSLPAVFVGLRFFPHYFVPLYLPLAIAAAPWTAVVVTRPLRRQGRVLLAWPLVMLAGFTLVSRALYRGPRPSYEEARPVFGRLAERLKADPCYGLGPLFVWGFAPELYVESGLRPATRFVVPQASLTGYVPGNRAVRSGAVDTSSLVRAADWDRLMADLNRSRPTFILDTAPSGPHGWGRYPVEEFPRLDRFVRGGYDAVAIVDGVWVWRRHGCQAAPGG
jgi:4-amino-4-deoxy-L-arabinose transferase-like glycosyltransferase